MIPLLVVKNLGVKEIIGVNIDKGKLDITMRKGIKAITVDLALEKVS